MKIQLKNPFAGVEQVAKKLEQKVGAELQKDTKVVQGWVAKARVAVTPKAPQFDGPSSGQNAGWLQKRPPPTTDQTKRFQELHEAAKAGRNTLPPEAKNHTYLMVGGLFTSHYPGYMDANTKVLKDAGLDARKVPLNTDAGVKENAKFLRDAILDASKNGKKVVLVGQSKGGVDISAALALYPELKPHVRAVVAMQAPYGGTPVASDMQNCSQLRQVAEGTIKRLLGGDPASLADLSYSARQAFVNANPYPSDIPTVSLATSRSSVKSILKSTEDYMLQRYQLKSDGLVVDKDAEIPGSKVVRLTDMDHAESVMEGVPGFPNYHPGNVTMALVTMALEK